MSYQVKIKRKHHQNALVEWCSENNILDYSIWISAWNNYPYYHLFEFQKESDALAFKVRWCD